MLGMFWIALELSNPMVGLITRLSLLAKKLTAFKFGKVAKSGNAAWRCRLPMPDRIGRSSGQASQLKIPTRCGPASFAHCSFVDVYLRKQNLRSIIAYLSSLSHFAPFSQLSLTPSPLLLPVDISS